MTMRILVIGAGGVGGYYGARLQEVGHDVVFAARGAHAEAMAAKGLKVFSQRGDFHLPEVALLDRLETPGDFDLVLVCVKLADTQSAADIVKPLAGPGTAILSLQNGIDGEAILGSALGRDDIMGGVSYISAHIKEPGVIEHVTPHAKIVFGEFSGQETPRAKAILDAFSSARFESELVGDIERQLWRKFVLLSAFAGACTLRGEDCGTLRANPEGRQLYQDLVAEAVAVGRAKGIDLPLELEESVRGNLDKLPGPMKPSMLIDLERGKPLELPWLSGSVARLGDELGIDTPASDSVVAGLADRVMGAQG
jgi:2-dehydropantoate 2-reductase